MLETFRLSVDFGKFASVDGASTVATLAMVCNDIACANSAVNRLVFQQPQSLKYMEWGTRL